MKPHRAIDIVLAVLIITVFGVAALMPSTSEAEKRALKKAMEHGIFVAYGIEQIDCEMTREQSAHVL